MELSTALRPFEVAMADPSIGRAGRGKLYNFMAKSRGGGQYKNSMSIADLCLSFLALE